VAFDPLERFVEGDGFGYRSGSGGNGSVSVVIDRSIGTATFTIAAPTDPQPSSAEELVATGADSWLLATARQLDDAVLHLRFNEPDIGTWVFATSGSAEAVLAAEDLFAAEPDHWLVREVRLFWARVLKRLDLSARTLVATIEPESAFVGLLAELVLAADRSYMLEGTWEDLEDPPAPATIRITEASNGWFPMSNGLSRLQTRFWGRDDALAKAIGVIGKDLIAEDALAAELITFAPDDLDWEDEVRLMLEERNSFSPDALTGMEANYRFVGPETMETKIFSRLSAWQNWIFQRPNAVGPDGALQRFGTGSRPSYDQNRV
jgi:benzoyl-CoA-dihydrodiol lyase